MTLTGRNTIDSPVGEIPHVETCPHCGRELKRTSINVMGKTYDGLPCWGSCGCNESEHDGTATTRAERRYRLAGIPERYLTVKADLEDYSEKVLSGTWLYIQGNNGTMKSGFAAALAMRILDTEKDKGVRHTARFENSRDVVSELQGIFDGNKSDVLDRLYGCDVLILDDLGKEQPTEFAVSMLYEIIDMRYRDCKPIVVTTNFTRGELAERLAKRDRATAEAIVSRLCDGVEVVDMYGDDKRMVA
ncbi:MAG: ATP-binding protein [Eggerthellaceae bacterium]|nr:ATP-binding protein [Eggerthellaceae bacterium]